MPVLVPSLPLFNNLTLKEVIMSESETPLLDELEEGPWPSFVTEMKRAAEKNEACLHELIAVDDGAKYIGEFGVGTNYDVKRFTKNILFDEKIGGTIHFALGAGYPQSGSMNESSIHLDILTDMTDGGRITVDGELIYESGRFLIE